MQHVEYVGSFEELMTKSEPTDPRFTAVALVRLPQTRGLEPRYAFVLAGPEAEQVTKLVGSVVDQISRQATKTAPG